MHILLDDVLDQKLPSQLPRIVFIAGYGTAVVLNYPAGGTGNRLHLLSHTIGTTLFDEANCLVPD